MAGEDRDSPLPSLSFEALSDRYAAQFGWNGSSIYGSAMSVNLDGRPILVRKMAQEIDDARAQVTSLRHFILRSDKTSTLFVGGDTEGTGKQTTELGLYARTVDGQNVEAYHYVFGTPRKAKSTIQCKTIRLDSPEEVFYVIMCHVASWLRRFDCVVFIAHNLYSDVSNLQQYCRWMFPEHPNLFFLDCQRLFNAAGLNKTGNTSVSLPNSIDYFESLSQQQRASKRWHNGTNDAKGHLDLTDHIGNHVLAQYGESRPRWVKLPSSEKPFVYTGGTVVDPAQEYHDYIKKIAIQPSERKRKAGELDSPVANPAETAESEDVRLQRNDKYKESMIMLRTALKSLNRMGANRQAREAFDMYIDSEHFGEDGEVDDGDKVDDGDDELDDGVGIDATGIRSANGPHEDAGVDDTTIPENVQQVDGGHMDGSGKRKKIHRGGRRNRARLEANSQPEIQADGQTSATWKKWRSRFVRNGHGYWITDGVLNGLELPDV